MRKSTRIPPERRFWESVSVQPEGCWEYLGNLCTNGYGKVRIDQKKAIYSHRFSWILHNGPVPVGSCVLHKCDNRACVRPDHLFLGTLADNIHDMVKKGRNRNLRGSEHGRAKLTEDQVKEIRFKYGSLGATQLAREYMVSRGAIYHAATGQNWKTVPV